MRLPWEPVRPCRVNAVPAASLAFLFLGLFAAAGVASTVRGIGLALEGRGHETAMPPPDARTVTVRVLSDGTARVAGQAVAQDRIRESVQIELDRVPDAIVTLLVEPETSWAVVAQVMGALLEPRGPEPRGRAITRVSIPTRRQIEDSMLLHGRDPFEDLR